MTFRGATLVALLLSSTARVAAQEPASVNLTTLFAPGDRVRVLTTTARQPGVVLRSSDPIEMVGVIERVDAGTVTVVTADGRSFEVPVGSIAAVDVSVGRKRQWLRGLLGGLAVGAAVGLLADVDPQNCGPNVSTFCSRGEALAAGTVLLGGIGAAVGAATKTDRWSRRFTRTGSAGVTVAPSLGPGHIGVIAKVVF